MSKNFDRQLKELHTQMITLGKLCEKAITLSVKVIYHKDKEIAEEVFQLERDIDEKEKEVESLCMKLLLRQQPVACDLREISAALEMVSDMERIGDQAADIADLSQHIHYEGKDIPVNIEAMSERAILMVTESLEAFVYADLALAKKVIADDDLVDEKFAEAKKELAEMMKTGKMEAEDILDYLMVAKYFERIGDHATNIGEWVAYSITGILE